MFKVCLEHTKIHWEKTKDVQASIKYCSKDDTRSGETFWRGIDPPYTIDIKFYEWERTLIKTLKKAPDDRTIWWFWEPDGLAGKTTFAKWCFLNFDRCITLSGKAADMKNAIVQYEDKNGFLPKIILIDIPRSSLQYVSYTGIEKIKDMFFFSGKYEGGMVCGRNPHVVCFANEPPEVHRISLDQWKIVRIEKRVNPTKELSTKAQGNAILPLPINLAW